MAFWDRISSRGEVEDRRGMAPVVGGVGLTGLALYLLFSAITGNSIDMGQVLGELVQLQTEDQAPINRQAFEGADTYEVFASTVLGSTNDLWTNEFATTNHTYYAPKLVLFRTATTSECGSATSEVGPHYCPLDKTIYLDETFFDELMSRFGAKGGDVAEAYVIAHEAGHHAQNELGIMDAVEAKRQEGVEEANELSVKTELQADCFAGLWAHSIKDEGVFEPREIQEALDAAAAVGDDRIQKRVSGYINPESWTHGSSEERVKWFTRGYESGRISNCNTF